MDRVNFDYSSDENHSLDYADNDIDKVERRMTLKTIQNRNPSAIIDPDTVRAGKLVEKKIKLFVTILGITFALTLLLLLLLVIHWTRRGF